LTVRAVQIKKEKINKKKTEGGKRESKKDSDKGREETVVVSIVRKGKRGEEVREVGPCRGGGGGVTLTKGSAGEKNRTEEVGVSDKKKKKRPGFWE